MCIDGTAKFEEEKDEKFELIINNYHLLIESLLKEKFSEIKSVNSSLLKVQNKLFHPDPD